MASAGLSLRTSGQDRAAVLSWRIYLLCLFLSFFVMIEPAPTDLVFFIGFACLLLTPLQGGRFLSAFAVVGVALYLIFSVNSLFFVDIAFILSLRAVAIEFYMILLFLVTAYFVAHKGDEAFFWILMALTLGALVSAFIGYLALADAVPRSDVFFRGEGVRNRLKSTFKDPNVFGPFLVPSILFTAWLMVSSRKFRVFGAVSFGMLLVVLIATLSRGAMVHVAVSLFIFFIALLIHNRSAKPTFMVFLVGSSMVCIVVAFFVEEIVQALEGSLLASRLSLQSYDNSRFSHVASSVQHMLEHPMGIGPFQARFKYGYLPHNTFVAFGLHNGIPAAIGLALIYLAAMGRCFMKMIDQKLGWTKYAFVFAVLAGLLILMQVVGTIHWRHMYVVCGLAFGVYVTDAPTDIPDRLRARWQAVRPRRPGWLLRRLSPQGDSHF
ncbi:MAG: O-antigen ligase family protein [Pseudomonadota bacterium]